MVDQGSNQNAIKGIRKQLPKSQKSNRIITALLFPAIVIYWFVGLSLFWTDDKRQISRKVRNRNRYY